MKKYDYFNIEGEPIICTCKTEIRNFITNSLDNREQHFSLSKDNQFKFNNKPMKIDMTIVLNTTCSQCNREVKVIINFVKGIAQNKETIIRS